MSRNSFFSNVPPTDEPIQHTSVPKSKYEADNEGVPQSKGTPTKRLTYSIKIDPTIRKSIKDWAVQHDVTISSVIETLARIYLNDLSVDDIKP